MIRFQQISPVGVSQGQAGPRLVALTAWLMDFFKQSQRRVPPQVPP